MHSLPGAIAAILQLNYAESAQLLADDPPPEFATYIQYREAGWTPGGLVILPS